MAQRTIKTYAEKMRRANREALITVGAFAVIVAAWLVGGFGLAGSGAEVLGTPIWIIGGCVGSWVVAIVVAAVLSKRVFVDFDFECDDGPSSKAGSSTTAGCSAKPDLAAKPDLSASSASTCALDPDRAAFDAPASNRAGEGR